MNKAIKNLIHPIIVVSVKIEINWFKCDCIDTLSSGTEYFLCPRRHRNLERINICHRVVFYLWRPRIKEVQQSFDHLKAKRRNQQVKKKCLLYPIIIYKGDSSICNNWIAYKLMKWSVSRIIYLYLFSFFLVLFRERKR